MKHSFAWAAVPVAPYYRVGDLLIDTHTRRVSRGESDLAVAGLSFDLLLTLVRAAPDLVPIDVLIEQVWQGAVVSPETVIQRAKLLRNALGESGDRPRYIGSQRGRGYRMMLAVTPQPNAPTDLAAIQTRTPSRRGFRGARAGALALAVLLGAGGAWWAFSPRPGPVAPRSSVAVLPFANLTGDPTKDYLGDGLAEELINTLIKVPGLRVPARTSTFAYKGRNVDIRQVAKDLGVGAVLEGSVREAGSRIRITAQLISARDGFPLWSQTYDRQFTDLFKLQDDVAAAIVGALKVDRNGAPFASLAGASPPTSDVEAYDLYLQGSALEERSTPETTRRALGYFQRALDRDPKFARAYVGIASATYLLAGPFAQQPVENLTASEHAARQALLLDPAVSGAQEQLAVALVSHGEWLDAETHLRAGLALSPDDANTHMARGAMLDNAGYLHRALDEQNIARGLAPASAPVALNLAIAYALLGRDSEARTSAQLAADLGWEAHSLSFVNEEEALHAKRYADAATAALAMLNTADPDQARTAEIVKLVYASLADPERKAAAMAARMRLYPIGGQVAADASATDARPCLQSGYLYVLLGELDAAYDLANHCLDSMRPGAIVQGPLARLWTQDLLPFRRDPRFQAFAARLGLMQYWREDGAPDGCVISAQRLTCR